MRCNFLFFLSETGSRGLESTVWTRLAYSQRAGLGVATAPGLILLCFVETGLQVDQVGLNLHVQSRITLNSHPPASPSLQPG